MKRPTLLTAAVWLALAGHARAETSADTATREFAQAGSTFKPFALAAATEKGIGLGTVWPGTKWRLDTPGRSVPAGYTET